jgi:hypothetical protein
MPKEPTDKETETKVASRTTTAWSAYPDRFDKVAETPADPNRFEGDETDGR